MLHICFISAYCQLLWHMNHPCQFLSMPCPRLSGHHLLLRKTSDRPIQDARHAKILPRQCFSTLAAGCETQLVPTLKKSSYRRDRRWPCGSKRQTAELCTPPAGGVMPSAPTRTTTPLRMLSATERNGFLDSGDAGESSAMPSNRVGSMSRSGSGEASMLRCPAATPSARRRGASSRLGAALDLTEKSG